MHAGPVRRSAVNTVANYFVRGLAGGRLRALTEFKGPTPQLTGVQKRLVTYTREDGIPLSGTLYLPPGYARAGGGSSRLPVVMWAYPTVIVSADAAGTDYAAPQPFILGRCSAHRLILSPGYNQLPS